MNLAIITEFIISSLLYIANTRQIVGLLSDAKSEKNLCIVPLSLYMISSFAFIYTELYFPNGFIRLLIFVLYYLFMLNYSMRINRSFPRSRSAYITLLYISVDSIIQSIVYLCFEDILLPFDKRLIMRSILLIVNLIVYAVLKYASHSPKARSLCIDTGIIPTRTYILILASLMLSGILLENQLIDIDETDIFLQSKITKLFTAVSIPMLILIIISLLINCITKSYYQNTSSLLEKQINMQLDYYSKLEKKNSELREFRHDFKNHMLCLQALIESNDCEEASQYIRRITNRSYSEPPTFFTGNRIADAILDDKSALAESVGAKLVFDGEIYDRIPAPDMCIILSNALDNAIEACAMISDADKIINVRCIFSKGVQIINISNPAVDTDDNSFHTTKADKINHGYGLRSIRRTVDMYSGMFSADCSDGVFTLEVGLNVGEYVRR